MEAAFIFWLMNLIVFSAENAKNYEECKAEQFKPKVCEKYKGIARE